MGETTAHFDAPRIVPVFPLPNTVFFPHTHLPLHVFEPRYRDLIRDVTHGDGMFAVSLIRGDNFHAIGTVGRIRIIEELEDDRYNLRLQGLARVEMSEVEGNRPYRQVRAVPRPESFTEAAREQRRAAKLELLACLGALMNVARKDLKRNIVLHEHMPFEMVVNTACAGLPVEANLRQRLLETDDLTERHRRVTEHLDDVLEAMGRIAAGRDLESDDLLN